ncbi:hypothetical protein ACWCOZ_19180 [Streptomyces sp. NPDC001840]
MVRYAFPAAQSAVADAPEAAVFLVACTAAPVAPAAAVVAADAFAAAADAAAAFAAAAPFGGARS